MGLCLPSPEQEPGAPKKKRNTTAQAGNKANHVPTAPTTDDAAEYVQDTLALMLSSPLWRHVPRWRITGTLP
jgi:hypothetical protein